MISNRDREIRKLKKQFNHIGLLSDTEICRLVGFAEDTDDWYYVVLKPSFIGDKPTKIYSSMVGPWESLKRYYPRYKQLEFMMSEVWNCPPQDAFLVETIPDMIY